MGLTCAGISRAGDPAELKKEYPALGEMRIFRSSAAHYLEDMREAMDEIELEENTPSCLIARLRSIRPQINQL